MANRKIIKAQMQQRRDTKANWASKNPVLLAGEIGIVSDDPNLYKVGDGTTAWNALPFRGFDGTLVHTTGNSETAVISQKGVTEELAKLSEETNLRFKESSESTKEQVASLENKANKKFASVDSEIENLKRGEAYVMGETLAFRNYADAKIQGNTLTL